MNKTYTDYMWKDEKFEGVMVKNLRVRIFEVSKSKRIDIYSNELIEHDGKNINGKVTEFSYILTSTGIQEMFLLERNYLNIKLYITQEFDEKVLDNINLEEIKYVRDALEMYRQNKKLESLFDFQELKAYIQELMPDDANKNYEELLKAIQTTDIIQIEKLTKDFPDKYKALVWENAAKIAATKK